MAPSTPSLAEYRYEGNCGLFRPGSLLLSTSVKQSFIDWLLTFHDVQLHFSSMNKWLKREIFKRQVKTKYQHQLVLRQIMARDKPNSCDETQ
jgi:hypothetical protein